MVRLQKEIHSLLSDTILNELFKRKIGSTLTFIETSPELISKITGLQFRQVLEIRESIITLSASRVRTGESYYSEFFREGALIATGIESLDSLLDGGIMTGHIYEFCGPSSCGKSQICIYLAAQSSYSCGQNVFYIDTKGNFSAQRLSAYLTKLTSKVGEAMLKIQIAQPLNAYELLSSLHNFKEQTQQDKEKAYGLLIVDSLAALFYQFIGEHKEGTSLLSSVCSILQYIANEMHMVVIVTNIVTSWQNSDAEEVQKASLGKFWSHIPTTRINMTRLHGSTIALTVTKSSMLELKKSVSISIKEDTIE